jgi:hypothetical protein
VTLVVLEELLVVSYHWLYPINGGDEGGDTLMVNGGFVVVEESEIDFRVYSFT